MRPQNKITVYGEKGKAPYTGFVYIWKNTKTNKFYIGSHMGYVDDGYVGSGSHFKNAYSKDKRHFRRKILEFVCGDYKKLLEREDFWLFLCSKKRDRYYNSSYKATGLHPYSFETISYMSKSKKNRKWYTDGFEDFLLHPTDNKTPYLSLGRTKKTSVKTGTNKGSFWVNNGEQERKLYSLEYIPDGWEIGRKELIKVKAKLFAHSSETKEKIQKANIGLKKSSETKLKISASKKGRRWYTNGTETKLSFSSPGEGWKEGRL